MNEKFFDLKKEKQDRMINAALKVFGTCGYDHASTDEIVREAGISKGLLFHYFSSKLGCYTFMYDYSVRFMTYELKAAIKPGETDFFALQTQMETGKLQILRNYPYMQLFLDRCEEEMTPEAVLAIQDMRDNFHAFIDSINEQADLSPFPNAATGKRLCTVLSYALHGNMTKQLRSGFLQPDMVYQENLITIALLKDAFSK